MGTDMVRSFPWKNAARELGAGDAGATGRAATTPDRKLQRSLGISMAEPITAVGFVFAYCRRHPTSAAEAAELPAVVSQRQVLMRAAMEGRVKLERWVYDLTTNRQSAFFERRKFVEVVQQATVSRSTIAVADFSRLLRSISFEKLNSLVDFLQNNSDLIWDASRDRHWHTLSAEQRGTIVSEAFRTNATRSQAIRRGLARAKRSSKPVAAANSQKGSVANRARADRLALQLEGVVGAEKAKLPPDTPLSPTALAIALNERRIPSPRGKQWSHNSAKNLMVRIAKLRGA
jgi:hypothetical protein